MRFESGAGSGASNAELAGSLFKSIVMHASDGIVVVDADGNVTFCNPAFAQLFQREPDAFEGELFGFPVADGEATEINVLRRDGAMAVAEMRVSRAHYGQKPAFIAMLRDITERKHTEDALREALDAARIADKAKDAFLANITHELRTPLSAVIGFSNLARRIATDPHQREYLDNVSSAGKSLAGIIDDLLDLSKIAAGRMEFENTPFSLRQLVGRCRSVIGFKAQEQGLTLLEQIDDDTPDVLIGDSLRVEQILLNLLSNAVKFTAAGRVALHVGIIACEAQRVCLSIEVEDTGIGLGEDDLARIFQSFTQADASTTRKFGGTGLGLAICKSLTELMQGDISVTSRKGVGSVFRATLWLGVGTADDLPVETAGVSEPERVIYQDARVLVVDDQPFNREIAQGLLSAVGITPHLAAHGKAALDLIAAATEGFDLVLMDIQMPIMDGLTATRAIRLLDDCGELPIVAMTAHTMVHEKQKCVDAGMNDHIGKPFDEAGFYRVLAKWIPHRKQQRQPAMTPAMTPDNRLPSLNGVDTRAGLALLLGDAVRYRHWLDDFVTYAPAALRQIRDALAAGDTALAIAVAHALKGRMGMLGMTELHAMAAGLEAALDDAPAASAMAHARVGALLLEMERDVVILCAEIRSGLGTAIDLTPAADPLPVQRPLEPPPASVTRLIARLQAGDGDCDRLFAVCLAELGETAWAPLLRRALSHTLNFDYPSAVQLLSGNTDVTDQGSSQGSPP